MSLLAERRKQYELASAQVAAANKKLADAAANLASASTTAEGRAEIAAETAAHLEARRARQ